MPRPEGSIHHPSPSPSATMLPQLPQDIWYRIASFSPPETLSALSKVSTMLHSLMTEKERFAPYISHTHLHPAQAFRREAALLLPPTTISSTPKGISQIFRARDTALLYDARDKSFIAFPKGYVFPLGDLNQLLSPTSPIPLRDELVGFTSVDVKKLYVLDLSSGGFRIVSLNRARLLTAERRVALAGNRGEWLIQRVGNKFIILDFHTGETQREILIPDNNDIKLVRGELSRSHDGTFVGYATTTNEGSLKTIHVYGFDGVNITAKISKDHAVESVLRSEDTLTHALIVRPERSTRPTHFLAVRGCSTLWFGELKGMRRPIFDGNGTFLMESRLIPLRRSLIPGRSTVCILLKGSGKEASIQLMQVQLCVGYADILWVRKIRGSIFTLVSKRGKDMLELLQFSCEKQDTSEKVLKKWIIPGIKHVRVIADHYILATSESKELHLIHFDKFCNGSGGVYACPLVGLLTYCYFPHQFRQDDRVLQ